MNKKSCTFAPTVSATLPVEQRTRAELLLLYYDIFKEFPMTGSGKKSKIQAQGIRRRIVQTARH
jgi:hypothetical protein